MVQFKNPLTNPRGFFSSQQGGFFAPPEGGRTLTGLIGDPRVNIGLAIAQGQPIGQAILGGALQAKQVRDSFKDDYGTTKQAYNPQTGETVFATEEQITTLGLTPIPDAAETKRRIVEGADGFQYYEDDGTRVLPDVKLTPEETKEYKSVKAKDGFLRYTEGPDKGKKVFPDIEIPVGPDFENESKLRQNFQDQSKAFKDVNAAYGRILSNDPTPAGDISLIFQYMKMLDPRSTVREGEFATVQNAGSIPEKLWARYNSAKDGTKLTDSMRADFMQQAKNLYATALDNQSYVEEEFNSFAQAYGFDPKRIVTQYGKPLEKKIFKKEVSTMTNEELGQLNASNLTPMQLDILKKELTKRGKTD
tara:strand:+ start:143 stop:1228 length:1086 start_codon:yes stop_codon:yes gene_type:complete